MEALLELKRARVVPFDVPGHKRGKGNRELTDFLGEACMGYDVNSMKMLDNLCHPVSVILEAEKLAAEAFGAAHAFFMVNGTTSAVQAMVLSVCKKGDKIILPRNVHRSVINALILCGALPVYINPHVNERLGIALGMSLPEVEAAIAANPDAKAILSTTPPTTVSAPTCAPSRSWRIGTGCSYSRTRRTAPIFTLGKISRFPPWPRGRTSRPSACINPAVP
jgi:arginine/lysine/ornithine decarboxylase